MTSIEGVRWATDEDDAALRRLSVRTPMQGPVSYCLEREPEFFALTRLQGDRGGRVAVVDQGAGIVAMAMMAPCRAWVGGAEQQCAYVGDLKVDPDHRNRGLAGRLVSFLGLELQRQHIDRLFFLALAGNPAMDLIDRSPGHFDVRTLRTIRNFLVPFGSSNRRESSATVRRATPESVPEMIELWNRNQRARAFSPVLDERLFSHWLSGLRGLEDFRLVHRDGVLTGFCAVWDASAIKQIRLLRLSGGMRFMTAMYNVLAPVLGRPRFPSLGQHLRFLYVAHACAEKPEDLVSLLDDVHEQNREEDYLYFDLALDRTDPLVEALSRFRSMTVDFELREARTPTLCRSTASPGSDDCAYFDVSLV